MKKLIIIILCCLSSTIIAQTEGKLSKDSTLSLKVDTMVGKGIRPYVCRVYTYFKGGDTSLSHTQYFNEYGKIETEKHEGYGSLNGGLQGGTIKHFYEEGLRNKSVTVFTSGDSIAAYYYYDTLGIIDSTVSFSFDLPNKNSKNQETKSWKEIIHFIKKDTVIVKMLLYNESYQLINKAKLKKRKRSRTFKSRFKEDVFWINVAPVIILKKKYNKQNQLVKSRQWIFILRYIKTKMFYDDEGRLIREEMFGPFHWRKASHFTIFKYSSE